MSDYRDFDEESPDDQMTRKERARWYHTGMLLDDGLTGREHLLLDTLREQGLDVRRNFMVNIRSGSVTRHNRMVEYA